MIYLFCVYLIYKGFEIFQTAFVSKPDNPQVRVMGIAIGIIAIVVAVIFDFLAITITEGMVEKIGNNMQNTPKF
jgi:uncharacterized membrane protein (DUF485 family)